MNIQAQPLDPFYRAPAQSRSDPLYYQDHINLQPALDKGLTGSGIEVLVIDSGYDSSSGQLNPVEAISFTSGSAHDLLGHGTSTASIVAAKADQFGQRGIAPGVDLYIAKATLGSTGILLNEDIVEAINWGIAEEVDIISMSFSGPTTSVDYNDAIQTALEAGIELVVSAGNADDAPIGFPGKHSTSQDDGIHVVGAVSRFSKAPFSQEGESLDLYAPGANMILMDKNDVDYLGSGTSFSAPIVAGAIALMMEAGKDPDEIYNYTLPVYDHLHQEVLEKGQLNIGFALHTGSDPALHTRQTSYVRIQEDITISYLLPEQSSMFDVSVYLKTPTATYDLQTNGNYTLYEGGEHALSFGDLSANLEYVGNLHGYGGIYDHLDISSAELGNYEVVVEVLGQSDVINFEILG